MKKIKRVFLKPGKDNKEERINFIKFWAKYVREHDDKVWSRQQNVLINSQLKGARQAWKLLE